MTAKKKKKEHEPDEHENVPQMPEIPELTSEMIPEEKADAAVVESLVQEEPKPVIDLTKHSKFDKFRGEK